MKGSTAFCVHSVYRTAAVVFALWLTACSSLKVSTDYDPSTTLASLRRYAWKREPQQKAGDVLVDTDTLLRQRIIGAIDAELARKGYVKVSRDPDFLVGFYFSRQRKLDESNYPAPFYGGYFGGPFYGYWGGWYYPSYYGYVGTYTREVEEGLLAVDFVAPGSDKLLWRGKVKDALRFDDSPEHRMMRIQKAVVAILDRFPPNGDAP